MSTHISQDVTAGMVKSRYRMAPLFATPGCLDPKICRADTFHNDRILIVQSIPLLRTDGATQRPLEFQDNMFPATNSYSPYWHLPIHYRREPGGTLRSRLPMVWMHRVSSTGCCCNGSGCNPSTTCLSDGHR